MRLIRYIKQVFEAFSADKGSQLSAALAYTGVFALAPLLIVIISVAGFLFGQKAAEGTLFANLTDVVGPKTADVIQHAIAHTYQSSHSGLAFAIGLIGSLLAAGALTAQLQNSFDTIFAVVPDPAGGIKRLIYTRIKNAITLVIGSLIVAASVILTAILSAAGARLGDHIGMPPGTLQVINILASLLVFIGLLYLIYRIIPDVRMPKAIVWWTAAIVGLLFLVGKVILGWVIGQNGTASAYGAAASLVTLLLWFYYTGQILLIGAEGMKVYANNHDIVYTSKRYTLKQKTINIKTKNNLAGRSTEKFARGFTKKIRGQR
jgi:membrane protein